jgi:cytochrome P450
MIHQRKALIAEEGPSYFADKEARGDYLDFLDICLQATNEDGTEISTEDIAGQCITFIAAGFGTTTAAISFTLYCLTKNKKYQDLCAEEAKEVSLQDPTPDLATLKKLKYITMCFKEATRLYPPVCYIYIHHCWGVPYRHSVSVPATIESPRRPVIVTTLTFTCLLGRSKIPSIAKVAEEGTVIDGHLIDAGTTVVVNIYGCHHNPTVWADPDRFNPERFNPESPDFNKDPFAWILYSAGPRNCIGQKYADMQSKVGAPCMLATWKLV